MNKRSDDPISCPLGSGVGERIKIPQKKHNGMKIRQKDIKNIVKQKYDQIAKDSNRKNQSSCCGGSDCCSGEDYSVFNDDYSGLEGYNQEADLGLGCGIPVYYADLRRGDTVLDLGSGAGNDCFVARSMVGDVGFVYGLDFSKKMVTKARKNAIRMGYENMKFLLGEIEAMPLNDNTADKVLSNCVLNLVPDKSSAFAEVFRVLKPGGSFCISDVVTIGDLPEPVLKSAEMYAGCVAGAVSREAYLDIIKKTGFSDIQVHKEKQIVLPDEMLSKFLSSEALEAFKSSIRGIYSITVFAK